MGYLGWGPGGQCIWRLSEKWNLNISASYMQKKFDGLAILGTAGPSILRVDYETTYGARLTYLPKTGLSVYLAYSNQRNTSNLNDANSVDENYDQSLVILGGVWDIF
jgi:hypothetical protein